MSKEAEWLKANEARRVKTAEAVIAQTLRDLAAKTPKPKDKA